MYLENPNFEESEKMLKIFKKIAKNKRIKEEDLTFFEDEIIGYMLHETQGIGHLSLQNRVDFFRSDFENIKDYILNQYLQEYNPLYNNFNSVVFK
ncbi:hypothetical protein [Riemerella anatipestifer]|uniref:hypothetical protein n=1 Tax=Riemerella anatipestifer TaxID=34085 RepID=UPI001E2AF250|nr:hypothetical protein [Riemerella anatipestifer]MCD5969592.1 hypothetical protein [Riemerella anatipestifer]MCU7570445.1 hypothetical protein [Riemerella anatipestifer]